MKALEPQDGVRHPTFGPGRVVRVLGEIALVNFFGEEIQVGTTELEREDAQPASVSAKAPSVDRVRLRQSYEAINLGVVPPNPDQLTSVSINGASIAADCSSWLEDFSASGLCRVVLGNYGSGKSHYLKLCEATSLNKDG